MSFKSRFLDRRRFVAPLAAAALAVMIGGASVSTSAVGAEPVQKNVVQTAVDAGQFNTLAQALQAADLVATLEGPGPYTVFAPTDAAFAKLPPATLNSLLQDRARLRAVLTYHVVPGKVTAADVAGLTSAKTVQGEDLKVSAAGGRVAINNAGVTQADIMADNGVIHVIDTVLLPPSMAAQSLPATGGADAELALPFAAGASLLLLGGLGLRRRFVHTRSDTRRES
jgi:LPXTG-motif cell wall-anchored protein